MLLIWFLILRVGVFPILLNLVVMIIDQLGNTLANMLLNLVKLVLVILCAFVLTGTIFSWFSPLPPNSVRSWNELEQKFHDHFYSGDNEAKLTDLTLVKQSRDESVSDYFKRFKEVKNRCFNLSISDKDLVDVGLNDLRSYLKKSSNGLIIIILMLCNFGR